MTTFISEMTVASLVTIVLFIYLFKSDDTNPYQTEQEGLLSMTAQCAACEM